MEKEEIKKLLLEELSSKVLWLSNEIIEQIKNNECIYFNTLVDELCDKNLVNLTMFSEEETLVLRKRFGIFDGGKKQSLRKIADMTGKTIQGISYILLKSYGYICRFICRFIYEGKVYELEDNKSKMSSLSINLDETFYDYPITTLKIDLEIIKKLYRNKINTLYDLLSYTLNDFKLKNFGIGKISYERIQEAVHNLGLKFIDELTDEEKRMIVEHSSKEVINNSNISWVMCLTEANINTFMQNNVMNIGDLSRYYKEKKYSHYVYLQNLVDTFMEGAKRIGIHIGYKISEDTIDSDEIKFMPLEELLSININDVEMSDWLVYKLEKLEIKTIGDVISHNKEDFERIDSGSREELFNIISKLGLFFKDDSDRMKVYAEEINFQISSGCHRLSSVEQMLFMYRSLINAKKLLEEQITEIDKEIDSLEGQLNGVPGYEKRKLYE